MGWIGVPARAGRPRLWRKREGGAHGHQRVPSSSAGTECSVPGANWRICALRASIAYIGPFWSNSEADVVHRHDGRRFSGHFPASRCTFWREQSAANGHFLIRDGALRPGTRFRVSSDQAVPMRPGWTLPLLDGAGRNPMPPRPAAVADSPALFGERT